MIFTGKMQTKIAHSYNSNKQIMYKHSHVYGIYFVGVLYFSHSFASSKQQHLQLFRVLSHK